VDVPPSHRYRALAATLAATLPLGCSAPAADTGDATAATTDTTQADETFVPTTSTSGPTQPPTAASTSEPACADGDARCEDPTDREVCQDGAWVDAPCPAGQGCVADEGAACQQCTCTPGITGGCADAGTIDTCDCFDFVPMPCAGNTACADVDEVIACHPIICPPGEPGCQSSEETKSCNATGTAWVMDACDPTQMCDSGSGTCKDACTVVAQLDSSLGCEFYAVDMPNLPPRDDFVFAVALSNPSSKAEAHVEIFDHNGAAVQMVASGTIDPRAVQIFPISGASNGDEGFYPGDAGFLGTGIARGRAFRVVSDVPIVATQFNPLGGANAFTTDASLLLPTHTLSDSYYHLAWDRGSGAGSTMIVVATADDTIITITPSVSTAAGMNGMPALTAGVAKALPPLDQYDYVQLSAPGGDLSATKITANADVAVFGGHSCGRVPDVGTDGCDHLEEQIFPINTWGEHYVAARAPQRADEPMIWRVLAAVDGTIVDFAPDVELGDSYELDAGELVEFVADGDFELDTNAGHPVLVAGFLYGCEAAQEGVNCPGDPSMVLLVPVEQWLSDYVFLVDFDYSVDSVKLVRHNNATVELDCLDAPVSGWTAITPDYDAAVVGFNAGACKPGTNVATGSAPFGIMVVGESESTSYAYPGGLQLKPINPQ
jgi:hypothetical protein